jgi:hypothetical protein
VSEQESEDNGARNGTALEGRPQPTSPITAAYCFLKSCRPDVYTALALRVAVRIKGPD